MSDREIILMDGIVVPSVTEVISALGFNRESLLRYVEWCCKEGFSPDWHRKDKAERGTLVHNWITRALLDQPQPETTDPLNRETSKKIRAIFEGWLSWAKGRSFEILLCEERLRLDIVRMHGKPDLITLLDGVVVLWDWKTSSDGRPKLEHWIQCGGYMVLAEHHGMMVGSVCIVVMEVDSDDNFVAVREHWRTAEQMKLYRELYWVAHDATNLHAQIVEQERALSAERMAAKKAATVARNEQKQLEKKAEREAAKLAKVGAA